MKFTHVLALVATAGLMLSACDSGGSSRDRVRAVGSSTVYPFAKMVSESFARSNPDFGSPLIESTGSGGGIALFCQGVGADTPDMVNASRRMKVSEFQTCQANGVTDITEIQVGLDGIAFASTTGGIMIDLSPEIVYEALAANPYGEEQTNETWQIRFDLPLSTGGAISANRRRAAEQFNAARESRINLTRNTVTQARSLHMTVMSDVSRVAAQNNRLFPVRARWMPRRPVTRWARGTSLTC